MGRREASSTVDHVHAPAYSKELLMPHSYEPAPLEPLGSSSPGLATLPEQSQLDFDLAFFDNLLEREPNYIDVLRCQGELLTRKGLHERALKIDRRLVALLPNDCVVHYNLACSLALAGEPRPALRALRTALEFGYDDLDYLLVDSDLDSLRSIPEFQELLREFAPAADTDADD
jgi:tetratricopeptide (TPR) repeat protein